MEDKLSFHETVRTTVGNLSRIVNVSVSYDLSLLFIILSSYHVYVQFDSSNYLRHLYRFASVSLIDTDTVTVLAPKVMHGISSIIDRQSPRTLQNYMIWRFMMRRAWNMPKRFRKLAEQFAHAFRGTNGEEPRSVTCAFQVNTIMSSAVSKIYIKEYFDKNTRKEVMIK